MLPCAPVDEASEPRVSAALIERAFEISGEKRRRLAGVLYRVTLGPDWARAFLGFAYLKWVDRKVDTDFDDASALEFARSQLRWLDDVYGARVTPPADAPERVGFEALVRDAARDGSLRPFLEGVLRTIEADVRRRHRIVSRRELDRWALDVGRLSILYLAHFAAPGHTIPDAFLDAASRAYVRADCLIDHVEDLAVGLVTIPAEDLESDCVEPKPEDPTVARWLRTDSVCTFAEFDSALRLARDLPLRMRLLARLWLGRKRRDLRSFLSDYGVASSGST